MTDDPELVGFLRRWLSVQKRRPGLDRPAAAVQQALPGLLTADAPARFRRGLLGRMTDLKALLARTEDDRQSADRRPAPPSSPRGLWLRQARNVADRWDEADWMRLTLQPDFEGLALVQAAVSQALDEALTGVPGAGPIAEHLEALRSAVERPYQAIPLPPAPRAPWSPAAYVFPTLGRTIARAVASAATGPRTPLADLLRQIEADWPVARDRLEKALRALAETTTPADPFHAALALLADSPAAPARPEFGPGPDSESHPAPTAPPSAHPALAEIDELARVLLAQARPEAQAFGRRLEKLAALPAPLTSDDLHQHLVGCLAFLDEVSRDGFGGAWVDAPLARLAATAETLGAGGQVLGAPQLDGQPLRHWTDLVTVVGHDDGPPSPNPRVITRVGRVGYLLTGPDGGRKALVRARVWVDR